MIDKKALVQSIHEQTQLIFFNMAISMKTCNRDWIICGTPVWRYFYHTLHSCDKWFINPRRFSEPWLHHPLLDRVDEPCDTVLSDRELTDYFTYVQGKVLRYIGRLTDTDLYEKPEGCEFTRMELVFGQFRHFMCHIGIFNGITIANTGRYPKVYGLTEWEAKEVNGALYDERG